jgi:hypothetical protein
MRRAPAGLHRVPEALLTASCPAPLCIIRLPVLSSFGFPASLLFQFRRPQFRRPSELHQTG